MFCFSGSAAEVVEIGVGSGLRAVTVCAQVGVWGIEEVLREVLGFVGFRRRCRASAEKSSGSAAVSGRSMLSPSSDSVMLMSHRFLSLS